MFRFPNFVESSQLGKGAKLILRQSPYTAFQIIDTCKRLFLSSADDRFCRLDCGYKKPIRATKLVEGSDR